MNKKSIINNVRAILSFSSYLLLNVPWDGVTGNACASRVHSMKLASMLCRGAAMRDCK